MFGKITAHFCSRRDNNGPASLRLVRIDAATRIVLFEIDVASKAEARAVAGEYNAQLAGF